MRAGVVKPAGSACLPEIGATLPLTAIHARVTFPPGPRLVNSNDRLQRQRAERALAARAGPTAATRRVARGQHAAAAAAPTISARARSSAAAGSSITAAVSVHTRAARTGRPGWMSWSSAR